MLTYTSCVDDTSTKPHVWSGVLHPWSDFAESAWLRALSGKHQRMEPAPRQQKWRPLRRYRPISNEEDHQSAPMMTVAVMMVLSSDSGTSPRFATCLGKRSDDTTFTHEFITHPMSFSFP